MKKSAKKILLLMMGIMLIFAMTGCDLDDEDDTSSKPAVTQSKEQSSKPAQAGNTKTEKKDQPAVQSNKDAPAKNVSQEAKNKSASSKQNVPGYVWIRTDMKVKVDSTVYPDTYIYSYEGQNDGKEYMKYLYRWKEGKYYTNGDLYFGCQVPPASIPAGEAVTLEMDYRMINFAGRDADGHVSVPSGDCTFRASGRRAKNADKEEFLWPGSKKGGEYHPNYLESNCRLTQKFTAHTRDCSTVGDETDIVFSCPAGTITWTYKLANK